MKFEIEMNDERSAVMTVTSLTALAEKEADRLIQTAKTARTTLLSRRLAVAPDAVLDQVDALLPKVTEVPQSPSAVPDERPGRPQGPHGRGLR